MEESSGYLVDNLILFGRLLRGLGLDVNPGRMIDLIQSLDYINLRRKEDFYHSTRCLLVQQREEIPLFDEAFEAFWRQHAEGMKTLDLSVLKDRIRSQRRRPELPPLHPADEREPKSNPPTDTSNKPPIVQVTRTYSEREILRHRFCRS
jgi:uncharacterized protein with von Willebrand factor type A (vWA) domain